MNIEISVWSDIACPWCFVGKAHLESAMQQLAADGSGIVPTVRWRAFELDPRPRKPSTRGYAERLAAKYQRSVEQAQEMIGTMTSAISDVGGHADFSKIIPANTFDAHRLIQWAGATDTDGDTVGAQHRLTDAFMRGYLGDGLDLSQEEEMLDVVESVKLSRSEAALVLNSERYADAVRRDEKTAEQLGIRGVPFFVVGDYGLSGAQPSVALLDAIHKAHAEVASES